MAAHAPKLVTAPSISQVARSDLAPKDRHRRPFTMGMWIASIDIQVDPPHAPLVIGYDTVDLDETATVLGAAEKLTLAILHFSIIRPQRNSAVLCAIASNRSTRSPLV
jgi:hypothetical protein